MYDLCVRVSVVCLNAKQASVLHIGLKHAHPKPHAHSPPRAPLSPGAAPLAGQVAAPAAASREEAAAEEDDPEMAALQERLNAVRN